MNEKTDFKPYIPAERITSEFTVASVITGILLAVIFGAANAYLGLRVGLTISASIPAAVVAMGVIRVLLRKNSILESNIVQTIGSAGESVAAGAIFTLPALFLWAGEGKMSTPSILEITLITLSGGLLGVFFMVPLRNALIVKEHNILPYPEGSACAEVLLAGEKGASNASTVFAGMGISAVLKIIVDGLKLFPSEISLRFKNFAGEIGTQIYPAVLSVGYICGPKISSYMFAGGLISWMVLIPAIVLFGSELTLYPATEPIGQLYASGGASAIWGSYIRYIGAGALAAGGIISLFKSLPLILRTFRDSVKGLKASSHSTAERTNQNLDMRLILFCIAIIAIVLWLFPSVPLTLPGAILVILFGFFFSAVSSRMVGLVGSSNNPISGMAIATLLFSTIILKATGDAGINGMQGAIAIGSIICIVAAIAGDTSQDLKTGYLLGATPRKQQIGELIGVTASALVIGGVLYLLNAAWGFGSEQLGAPQAMLMKMIVEGVMENNLPWALVYIGVFLAIAIEILGIPVLPFAIGVYLPVQLNACIMVGGLIRLILDKKDDFKINSGILYCSGMIAGEGLAGILLAILAVVGIDIALPVAESELGSLMLFLLIVLSVLKFSLWKKKKETRR